MGQADELEEDDKPELTCELLAELYQDRELSIGEIAAETGYSKRWIYKQLDACDIETRQEGRQTKYHDLDDELLEYIDWLVPKQQKDLRAVAIEGQGIAEQAQRRGVKPSAVQEVLGRAVDRLEAIAEERD